MSSLSFRAGPSRGLAVAIGPGTPRARQLPHLDSRDAVGHLLEGGLLTARDLGAPVELVRRVVGGIHLEGAVAQARPDRLLRRPVTKRRAAAPLGAFDAGL